MRKKYHPPAFTANRVLTMDELMTIYDTLDDHSWPSSTPPSLYCEMKDGRGLWMHWDHIRQLLEGRTRIENAGEPLNWPFGPYMQGWRLWPCRPTEEERKAVPWDE